MVITDLIKLLRSTSITLCNLKINFLDQTRTPVECITSQTWFRINSHNVDNLDKPTN